jgi:hypothetical protein
MPESRESIVYHNKTESLKHENCFNDNVVSEKAHSSNKYLLCLIQGINNYVQINRYWRYIVRIMASNILLLASTFFSLTSQGLVGAGMYYRALTETILSYSLNTTTLTPVLTANLHVLILILM